LAFVIAYRVLTHGHWRDTHHGRHVMVFSEICALVFAYSAVSFAFADWLRPWLRVAIFLSMAALFLWRLRLLLGDQRAVAAEAAMMSDPVPVPEPDPDAEDYRGDGYPPKETI
jgi:hypothetical protein